MSRWVRVACTVVPAAGLVGQCATTWLPGEAVPGTNGDVVAAAAWDADGPGPGPARLVLAGYFGAAGTAVGAAAAYEPTSGTWTPLGSGIDGPVTALATTGSGNLYAAGFALANTSPFVRHVGVWNGTAWIPLGTGFNTSPEAVAVLGNGDVVAGGNFTSAGGVAASSIARWNGTTWRPLGQGIAGQVRALATMQNGDLVVGGSFTGAGTTTATNIARWNGTTWSTLGAGANAEVLCLLVRSNGTLIAGGRFTTAGGVPAQGVAAWNGSGWTPLGSGLFGGVEALATASNGDILAADAFGAVSRWTGSAWITLGTNPGISPNALVPFANGNVYVVGASQALTTNNVARWNGSTWGPLGLGINDDVLAVVGSGGGDYLLGGKFPAAGGHPARGIVRRVNGTWLPLGTGIATTSGLPEVRALARRADGNIVVAGRFDTADGVPAVNIALWNGQVFAALGAGIPGEGVDAVAVLADDSIAAAATRSTGLGTRDTFVTRWDGNTWTTLGGNLTGGFSTKATALAAAPNGDLFVGGVFTTVGGVAANDVARWDGQTWRALGVGLAGGLHGVRALVVLPNQDLVAGGDFSSAGGNPASSVARWNGSTWSPMGTGAGALYGVAALTVLANGDVVAGGAFRLTNRSDRIARWNGSTWTALTGHPVPGMDADVLALTTLANGDLVAGGHFAVVDGVVSNRAAQLTTPCPASAITLPAPCGNPPTPLRLDVVSLPWAGGTFASRATGFPASALGATLVGIASPNTALSALHPAGLPGCRLLASADAVLLVVPANGAVSLHFPIPNTQALAGAVLFHQVLQATFGGAGGLQSLASSNGVRLTCGVF